MKREFMALDSDIDILSRKINDNGYLVLSCIFARTGVQERFGAEISSDFEPLKLYKEYRSPEEVFKGEVLEGFKNVVITNDHPQELLTPSNTKYHAIGFVSSPVTVIDGAYLQCEITIFDEDAIEDIQNGKAELSAGYLYNIMMVNSDEYDYIQTDIKPNHIAIVQAGRCGSVCSIAFDSISQKGQEMKIVFKRMLPDGSEDVIAEIEVDDASAQSVQGIADLIFEQSKKMVEESKALDENIEAMRDEIKAKDEDIEAKADEIARLQAEIDTSKQVVATDAKVAVLAKDMASVMLVAMDAGIDTEGKSICDLKRDVIEKVNPDLELEGKDQAYIGYAFDAVATQIKNADASFLKALDIKPSKALDEKQTQADEAKAGFDSKFGGEE